MHIGCVQEDEINSLKQEIVKVNKLREGIQRKLRGVEEQKAEVETKRDSLKQHMASLERGTYKLSEMLAKKFITTLQN